MFRRLGPIVFIYQIGLGAAALGFVAVQPLGAPSWGVLAGFCIAGLLGSIYLLARSIADSAASMLYETGIFFVVSSAVYYAFGPLIYTFGPKAAVDITLASYPHGPSDALWTTGLNFIGAGVTGLAYVIVRFRFFYRVSERAAASWAQVSPTRIFIGIVAIGTVSKYLLVLPYDLGISGLQPPGFVRQLSVFLIVALLIGYSVRGTGRRTILLVSTVLLVSESITGILMFNKSEALLPLVAVGLGDYLARRHALALALAVSATVFLYITITPLASFGRDEMSRRSISAVVPTASLSERAEIVQAYFDRNRVRTYDDEVDTSWWMRLNYLPMQQLALDSWNEGNGGGDFELVPWIFVPRLLYQDKPTMTDAGIDLYEKLSGSRTSSVGVGIAIDGYYNLGWFGLFVACATYGIALRIFSEMSFPIVRKGALAMYPIMFMGIHVGIRVDGSWLADVAGALVLGLAALAFFRAWSRR
jgi:hypothetical protein